MAFDIFTQLGEWNPQLVRELKGRLKPQNVLIATVISLGSQLLMLLLFASELPGGYRLEPSPTGDYSHYCTGESLTCLTDSFGNYIVNWSLWWTEVFICLSIAGIFTLLAVGTYLLISDLSKEKFSGTLNFIRLTPQSAQSILFGKMLGVPIVLYLVGFLALPLHLFSGLSAEIPLVFILGFYAVLAASCLFFYSLSQVFGLLSTASGGIQALLGSALVLLFLAIISIIIQSGGHLVSNPPLNNITLLAGPLVVLPYLKDRSTFVGAFDFFIRGLDALQVFGVPVGTSGVKVTGLVLLNYGLWTYWLWQGLKRRFHTPSATLLSKQQSYCLTATFNLVLLAFGWESNNHEEYFRIGNLFGHLWILVICNLLLFLFFIAALSPHRQAMQDWARYRHRQEFSRKRSLMQDLIRGEKSPAIVAIGINIAIASAILLPWIQLRFNGEDKIAAVLGVLLTMSLILVYASIAQLTLFIKHPKRAGFAATAVVAAIVLPPLAFGYFSLFPGNTPSVWLFSAIPWIAIENTTGTAVILTLVGQSLIWALLNLQLTRQLRQAGQSTTKALMSSAKASVS
jgi:ABC-type transport system involved in multi-copper enzyme maturation permease subunit